MGSDGSVVSGVNPGGVINLVQWIKLRTWKHQGTQIIWRWLNHMLLDVDHLWSTARWDASWWGDKMIMGPHYLGDGGMFVVVTSIMPWIFLVDVLRLIMNCLLPTLFVSFCAFFSVWFEDLVSCIDWNLESRGGCIIAAPNWLVNFEQFLRLSPSFMRLSHKLICIQVPYAMMPQWHFLVFM